VVIIPNFPTMISPIKTNKWAHCTETSTPFQSAEPKKRVQLG
jgi:hypothetical protein